MDVLLVIIAIVLIAIVAFCGFIFIISIHEHDSEIAVQSLLGILGSLLLVPLFVYNCCPTDTKTNQSQKESIQNVEHVTSTKEEPRRDTVYIGSSECEKTTYDTEDIDDYYKRVILGE